MNKLWLYGCSFSRDVNKYRTNKGWFDYIAQEFNLDIIDETEPGFGWSFVRNRFYNDIPYWGEDDLIIVQSSHLVRMYSEFLQTRFERFYYYPLVTCTPRDGDEKYAENLLYLAKDIPDIRKENWTQFLASLRILNKLKKNWFWWAFEFYPDYQNLGKFIEYEFGDRLLHFEDGIKTFDEWMRKNPNFCTNPPDDLHQTYECHEVQGKLFIEQIKNYEQKVKSSSIY